MTDCIRLTTKEDYIRRVNIVRNYVYSNVDKDICLAELATLSAFSPYHFHRIMKAFLGEPIGAFIIRTKMEAAAKQLRFTENTISDIAYSVGYDTPSSLTKAFVKLYGISPSEFRTIKNYKIMTEQNPTVMLNLSRSEERRVGDEGRH